HCSCTFGVPSGTGLGRERTLPDFLCFDAKMVATNFALTQNKSMPLRRYLETPIREDLPEKMVFVAGPRQVGKTTLAQEILATVESGIYLSWDSREDRREIRAARWPGAHALVVLDELHKWRAWKSW